MTLFLSALAFLAGFLLRAVLKVEPSVITLARQTDDWVELPNGVRERLAYSPMQTRTVLDQRDAARREVEMLRDLLREKRLDEIYHRELHLVFGAREA